MLEHIEKILQTKNDTAFLDMVKEQQYLDKIIDNPWEIVSIIINQINKDTLEENPTFYVNLMKGLDIIAEKIQPDDMVLILIKEIGNTKCDSKFLIILRYLQDALIKILPTKRISYLTWSLNAVQTYISELPAPDNMNLENEERLLMDADENVARISSLYYEVLPFYDKLVPVIFQLNCDYKLLLTRNILQLLDHPLVYLDMDVDGKPQSKARIVAENLVNKIITLSPDTYTFLEKGYLTDHEEVKIKEISLGVFYYLHVSESIGLEKSPKVYDPIYIFQNILNFVVPLLALEHQFIIEKGLKLMSSLLKITSSCILPYQLLDSNIHCKFCKSIANVIIYNRMEVYRKSGLKIFHEYIYNFDSRGKYLLIYNIVKNIDNVSLTAYLVTQYKQMLVEQLDKRTQIDYYFQGTKLLALIIIFCYLPEGAETDLIKSADKIIASLNLLRYLILRDKMNMTGIWDHIKLLQKTFLDPLKEALVLSKAHYNLKMKEILEDNAHGDKSKNDNKLTVTIGDENLPELTPNEKMNVINSSLTAFDVIDSLLSRLNECIEYRDDAN